MSARSSVSSSTPPSSAQTSGGSRAGGWHGGGDESQSIRKVGVVPQEVRQSSGGAPLHAGIALPSACTERPRCRMGGAGSCCQQPGGTAGCHVTGSSLSSVAATCLSGGAQARLQPLCPRAQPWCPPAAAATAPSPALCPPWSSPAPCPSACSSRTGPVPATTSLSSMRRTRLYQTSAPRRARSGEILP